MRLRPTAPATFRDTVKPNRGDAVAASGDSRGTIWIVKSDEETRAPFLVARTKSARLRKRSGGGGVWVNRGEASAVTPPSACPSDQKKNQAHRTLRPRARRALSTLRPFLVAMRARKPWRALRTRLDGWKVRFIAAVP